MNRWGQGTAGWGSAVTASSPLPPLGSQIGKSHGLPCGVVDHHLDVPEPAWHQLRHQFSTCSTRRTSTTVAHDRQNTPNRILTVGDHVENCVALGTDSQGAGSIHADARVDSSRGRLHCSCDTARLDVRGHVTRTLNRLGRFVQGDPRGAQGCSPSDPLCPGAGLGRGLLVPPVGLEPTTLRF